MPGAPLCWTRAWARKKRAEVPWKHPAIAADDSSTKERPRRAETARPSRIMPLAVLHLSGGLSPYPEVVAMMDPQTVLAVCAIFAVVVEIIGLSRNSK